MPGKKKGKGKKKGGKGSRKSSKSKASSVSAESPDPRLAIPPPPKPGERLVKLLTTHTVDEKEVCGVKVSTRVLEQLTPQEIRDLKTVFEIFDHNSDGFVGASELKRAMRALGFKVSREECRQMISDVSLKGKGVIDFNEFLETIIDRQSDTRDIYDEILKGFAMFDDDKKGSISLENLRQACTAAGVKFTQKELEEMIEEADINGDGVVDQAEFIRIMLQTNLF